jgi:tRNA-(ms[2]io[6]A)-hydroxylase
MLQLATASDPRWLESALAHLPEILLDHAHCEKKAAGAAIKLLFAYPHHRFLQEPIAELAREELVHFEAVLALLERRGIAYRRQTPSAYGGKLHACVRASEPERALDVLLVAALIEARSCERFGLLADAVADAELADFYRGLLASEARHHGLYVELARKLRAPDVVRRRLAELARAEAEILSDPAASVRLHS